MSVRVKKSTNFKAQVRMRHRRRIRSKVSGTPERPRLAVFRSNSHLYAQLIDDQKGQTIATASTLEEELRGKVRKNLEGAKTVGGLIAKRAMAKNINQVCFDRGGYLYHGRVKALAEGAREGGLKF